VKKLDPGTGPGGSPLPPPPGFLISPKVGVVGLLIAFGLAGIAYVALGLFAASDDAAEEEGPPPLPGSLEHVDEAELAAIIPEEISRELEAELKEWFQAPKGRDPITDSERVVEPQWAAHLLGDDVRRRMDRLPVRVFGTLENVPAVIDEPGLYRGTLVGVWARLDAVDEARLRLRDGDRDVHRLTLTDHAGLPWVATVTAPPPEDVQVGDWVKVVGAFTKKWPMRDGSTAFHVFSTRAPVASFPPVTHETPRVEWLQQVRDETPTVSVNLEDEPFYGMLNYVRGLGARGYRELRDSGALEVEDLTGTQGATPLVEAPQVWRFRAVRLRVAPLHKEFVVDRSLGENPGNVQFVFRGYVVDDQNQPILWVSPFGRDEFDFKGARVADVEGFFFKRRQVSGANRKAYYLPILIGTDIEPVEVGPVGPSTDPKIILGIVLAGSVVMLFVLARTWRQSKAAEVAVRERSAQRRARHEEAASRS
jgi:hypothetical protein